MNVTEKQGKEGKPSNGLYQMEDSAIGSVKIESCSWAARVNELLNPHLTTKRRIQFNKKLRGLIIIRYLN